MKFLIFYSCLLTGCSGLTSTKTTVMIMDIPSYHDKLTRDEVSMRRCVKNNTCEWYFDQNLGANVIRYNSPQE